MKINFESVKVKLLPREGIHPRRPQPESGSRPPRKPGRRTFTLIHIIDIIKCCDCSVILRRRGTLPSCCPGPRCAAGSDPCQDHPGHSGDRITSFCKPPKNQLINQGNVFVPGQPPSQGGEQHWHELGTWGDSMAYDIQWYAGMVLTIMIYDD